ncbi:hypothetical protein [Streptomyces sp. NPDC006552]|uniref:hypothetical protein n=1 Tax=Streptomyces sp. NPDC006552 TaxID=3157179 RepID=UPI0033BF40F0
MTFLAWMLLAVAALFAVLGSVNQQWLRQRFSSDRGRATTAPSGWYRFLFLLAAALAAYQGGKGLWSVDKTSWSTGELRDSVHSAASAMESEPRLRDAYDDYSSLIQQEVERAGEGMGPYVDIKVEAVDEHAYAVTATGAGSGLCMDVSATESDQGGMWVPGAGDQPPTRVPAYQLTVHVAEGEC